MARNNTGKRTSNRSSARNKDQHPLLAGVLIGIFVTAGLAAGVSWYIKRSPSPFLHKEKAASKAAAETAKPSTQKQTAKSPTDSENGKPRFEFYKVLTDKSSTPIVNPSKAADKTRVTNNKQAIAFEPQLLQAGSFSNQDEAEKLKAKLAMLGVEANIHSASIPDKGVWYRVRLGPYKSEAELNKARGFLKQNGIDSTPMRVQ